MDADALTVGVQGECRGGQRWSAERQPYIAKRKEPSNGKIACPRPSQGPAWFPFPRISAPPPPLPPRGALWRLVTPFSPPPVAKVQGTRTRSAQGTTISSVDWPPGRVGEAPRLPRRPLRGRDPTTAGRGGIPRLISPPRASDRGGARARDAAGGPSRAWKRAPNSREFWPPALAPRRAAPRHPAGHPPPRGLRIATRASCVAPEARRAAVGPARAARAAADGRLLRPFRASRRSRPARARIARTAWLLMEGVEGTKGGAWRAKKADQRFAVEFGVPVWQQGRPYSFLGVLCHFWASAPAAGHRPGWPPPGRAPGRLDERGGRPCGGGGVGGGGGQSARGQP